MDLLRSVSSDFRVSADVCDLLEHIIESVRQSVGVYPLNMFFFPPLNSLLLCITNYCVDVQLF